MYKPDAPRRPPKNNTPLDLEGHRRALHAPTYAMALLACMAGATVTFQHPGRLIAMFPNRDTAIEIRVRVSTASNEEVAALYEELGHVPPAHLRRNTNE